MDVVGFKVLRFVGFTSYPSLAQNAGNIPTDLTWTSLLPSWATALPLCCGKRNFMTGGILYPGLLLSTACYSNY